MAFVHEYGFGLLAEFPDFMRFGIYFLHLARVNVPSFCFAPAKTDNRHVQRGTFAHFGVFADEHRNDLMAFEREMGQRILP